MVEPENPYRHDVPGVGPFVGRRSELEALERAMSTGRNALAAVMGGRGMGKTSLLGQLRRRLGVERSLRLLVVERVASRPMDFVQQLSRKLAQPIDPAIFVDDVCRAVDTHPSLRTILLLDEVDGLIDSDEGRDVLENLRVAYEQLGGSLAAVVFGGSRLRQLLTSDVSPFLRTARWIRLAGLSIEETARLVNEPLSLGLSDAVIDALWEQTGGHPLLLQALMEMAVDLGTPIVEHLSEAMEHLRVELLEPRIFPIWWDNLTQEGQSAYRTLVTLERPLPREHWARTLGDGPDAVVEILEATGLARVEQGALFARSSLFAAWLERAYPGRVEASQSERPHGDMLDPRSSEFERVVVRAIERWARHVVEHPTPFLRSTATTGNASLVPEQNFQLGLVGALKQHELVAEPESLSSLRGRVDVKARPWGEPQRRACIELKIWGRNDYEGVVEQLLEYCIAEDDFGCVVVLDRWDRSLLEAYQERCLGGAEPTVIRRARDGDRSPLALMTEHDRKAGSALRVYHFLVQLPR